MPNTMPSPSTPPAPRLSTAHAALFALCLGAFGLMFWAEVTRFLAGRWYLADVGNIWVCLCNTMNGQFMWSPMVEVNHFACHFTPLFLLLLPLTWLSAYPVPLVGGYVLAIALCPIPIYVLARRAGVCGASAVAVGALFLGNIFVGSLALSAHFESWFVLFMLWTMAAWHRRGWRFWVPVVLTFSVREDACVWVGGYALFELWQAYATPDWAAQRTRLLHVAVACAAWLALAFGIMAWVASANPGASNFADYGSRVGGGGFGADTALVLLILIASTAGLAAFGGRAALLCLLPAPLLLVGFPFMRSLNYYYSYPFLPYLALASIAGFAAIHRRISHRKIAKTLLIIFVLAAAVVQWFMPSFTDGYRRLPRPLSFADLQTHTALADKLPRNAPVVVSFGAFGSVPYRPGMLAFNEHNIKPEHWVVLWPGRQIGMDEKQFIKLAMSVTDEMQDGRRKCVYRNNDLLILTPRLVTSE